MIETPMDVLRDFPVRKSNKQKQVFRDAVQDYLKTVGYDSKIEKGSMGCRNIVIGDPEKAEYLITAHYDTPAWLPFPNLITPCNALTFILYQLFVVAIYVIAAIAVGVVCGLLAGSPEAASMVGVIVYWILLILMLAGPANRHNANDNTSGVVSVLEIARSLPENYRGKVCFVLFDMEELGLVGSSAYRKAHKKASEKQLVLNFDCVGDGDEIVMFPTKKLKKDTAKLEKIRSCACICGHKRVSVREKGFSVYPSDQKNFPYGVGIAAFNRRWGVLYCGRIHTNRDTVLEVTNVNILRAGIVSMLCRPE